MGGPPPLSDESPLAKLSRDILAFDDEFHELIELGRSRPANHLTKRVASDYKWLRGLAEDPVLRGREVPSRSWQRSVERRVAKARKRAARLRRQLEATT